MRPGPNGTMAWQAALAVAAAIALGAPAAALAQTGTVTIKGKWWSGFGTGVVSANELKMICRNVDGQLLDASVPGVRTFTLHFVPDCFVWNDLDLAPLASGDFVFTGEEIAVEKNGSPKPFRQFSGVLTAPANGVRGAVSGRMKCKNPAAPSTCTGEKGTFTYSRLQVGPPQAHKVFIGKYQAKFE
jgi:hypothetical protein